MKIRNPLSVIGSSQRVRIFGASRFVAIAISIVIAIGICFNFNSSSVGASTQININAPALSFGFGTHVAVLSTGNIVVTAPTTTSPMGGPFGIGAVHLYNGASGALISTMTGSSLNDNVGSGGIRTLSNGNFVIISPNWSNGASSTVGAITHCNGTTGCPATVTAANSLVGTTAGDLSAVTVNNLTNGNYVVRMISWNNGAMTDAGAVTFCDGLVGCTGTVSAATSLVGSTANDQVGLSYFTLANSNFVIGSGNWDNGAATNAGAATFCSGTSGCSGAVSAANSLVGSAASDQVGVSFFPADAVVSLGGNYTVNTARWDNGATVDAGAVTLCTVPSGCTGTISSATSLVGTSSNDQVGGVVSLGNGDYAVYAERWDKSGITDAGAVVRCPATGCTGPLTAAIALTGSVNADRVGNNVNRRTGVPGYIVASPFWDNAGTTNIGASTFCSDANECAGTTVSTANSLVGTTAGDQVGDFAANWDNGAITDAGAVTLCSGPTGCVGTVSTSNSVHGSTSGDRVGTSGGRMGNDNYLVTAFSWDNGAIANAGAARYCTLPAGCTGPMTPANSLVGSTAGDNVGNDFDRLNNGNFVLHTPFFTSGGVANAGAVTFCNGTTGCTGTISAANSMLGTSSGDRISSDGTTAISNGDFVFSSFGYDNGASPNCGAVTYYSGTTGTFGTIDTTNSVIGASCSSSTAASMNSFFDAVNNQLVVGRPNDNLITLFRPEGAPPSPSPTPTPATPTPTVTPTPACTPLPVSGREVSYQAEGNGNDSQGPTFENGTLENGATFGTGRIGQGFVLDGTNDRVQLGNPANLQLQTFTIEMWIKRSSSTVVTNNPASGFNAGTFLAYGSNGFGFAIDEPTNRVLLTKIGVSSVLAPTLPITDTNFHHIAVTKSGNQVIFYVDGVGGEMSARRASVVTVPIEIESADDTNPNNRTTAISFTVGWNGGAFRLVEARLGQNSPNDASLAANTSQIAGGKLGLLIDSVTGFETGQRQIILLRLAVETDAQNGIYPMTIDDSVTPRQTAGREGEMLATIYSAGRIEITDAAATATVSGRVLTPDGRGIRHATVTITDQIGLKRTTTTSSFGYYTFDAIEAGTIQIVGVSSKRYRFAAREITISDQLNNIDLLALE